MTVARPWIKVTCSIRSISTGNFKVSVGIAEGSIAISGNLKYIDILIKKINRNHQWTLYLYQSKFELTLKKIRTAHVNGCIQFTPFITVPKGNKSLLILKSFSKHLKQTNFLILRRILSSLMPWLLEYFQKQLAGYPLRILTILIGWHRRN